MAASSPRSPVDRRRLPHAEGADLRREVLGDPEEGAGTQRLGHRLDDGVSLVRGRADIRRERDLAEEGDPTRGRESPGAAAAEDLLTVAAGAALEAAHVLDQPSTGVRSVVNMEMAFSATLKARSCGVEASPRR